MAQVGKKVYYELSTGNIISDTGEREGSVVETTQEQDFEAYAALAERVPATVGVIQLAYGELAADFAAQNGYRINAINEPFDTPMSVEYDEENNETSLSPADARYRYGCTYSGCTVDGQPVPNAEFDAYGRIVVTGQATTASVTGTKTAELEFSYPDPNEPEAPPVYRKPLSVEMAEVKAENEQQNLSIIDIFETLIPLLP